MDIVRRAFEIVRCLLPLHQTNHLFLPSWEKWWAKYSVVQVVVATEGSCFVRTTLSPLKSADVQTLNLLIATVGSTWSKNKNCALRIKYWQRGSQVL
jgi:hypothetical protein